MNLAVLKSSQFTNMREEKDIDGCELVRMKLILYYTILYYTILYHTILYYTVIYCYYNYGGAMLATSSEVYTLQ